MSIIKTEAFVLKSFKYGETSKIVTLFTKDYGKMNAIVKGARNFKSRLCGTLESMNHINAIIYLKENRELQLLSNAEYKNSFSGIFNDFRKLEAAFKIIEIMNKSIIENEINKQLFELLLNTFSKLNSAKQNYFNYVLLFQIRLATLLGFSQDFSKMAYNFETFFAFNEFYVSTLEIGSLTSMSDSTIDNVESVEIDETSLLGLILNFEKFLSANTQGSRYYKSTKVFQEINKNI